MDQGSEPTSLCVPMAFDSAVSLDDFRTHFGGAIVELLLTIERAAQLIVATCKEMPETAEKQRLVDQRCKLVRQAIYLRRLLSNLSLFANEPVQLMVVQRADDGP
ncbi:hypothetical protein [Bradyrhizobium sp. 191]|uniref:hypothetical protein n=1 Tax=Bradyrhizobium sp. 191 TaxID=2782659 RepID=UPI001FFF6FB4|nr:hypothetical protein [Bradyrhizobium sp. 191]UPJ63761.1 hypothetical protein IVB23_27745 [Bradyrhizobium sp. 191]